MKIVVFFFNILIQNLGLGACLMAVFLAIDTQLLMGNKKYKFNEEDYINAALQLYLDICYIFIYILQAVGGASK